MASIISHPLYLAALPLYTGLYKADRLVIDDTAPFVKQTLRNRTTIATENGAQTLTIPVMHNGRSIPMRDIRISEHGNWRHQHWNALVSAYRKSPFFEYYADDFALFYEERDGFLIDFNMRLHRVVRELLGLERKVELLSEITDKEVLLATTDARHIAEPRTLAEIESCTKPYYQVFSQRNGFIPNLSIIDLLFNMGPEGLIVLRDGK